MVELANGLIIAGMTTPALFIVASVALVLLGLERAFPLRTRKAASLPRLFINLLVSLTTFGVAFLLVQPVTRFFLNMPEAERFGLIPWLGLSGPAAIVTGFLLLDLSFYYWHVANHKVPLLWRFHNVHHIDPDLDISTGFRFHPGEVAFSTIFRALQVTIIGVSAGTFAVYEIVFQLATFFHHSNIRIPVPVERLMNLVLVTPRMHGIHHSSFKNETDSNYSVVFSIWDRLHRSLGLGIPQRDIVIGVPAYLEKDDNTLKEVFMLPFHKQRAYWKAPSGELRLSRDGRWNRRAPWLAG